MGRIKYYILPAIILVLILTLAYHEESYSQVAGKVYNQDFKPGDTVDMGLVYGGIINHNGKQYYDSLITSFIFENNYTADINAWAFYLGRYLNIPVGHENDFNDFSQTPNDLFPVHPGEKDTVKVEFQHNEFTNVPMGKKYVTLRTSINDAINPERLDSFYIIARKSLKLIDGYDQFLDFDTVFAKPVKPVKRIWKLKNLMPFPVTITNHKRYQSPNSEIQYDTDKIPAGGWSMDSNKIIDWEITYNPTETGFDTAEICAYFYPNNLDKLDSASVDLHGYAVKQSLVMNQTGTSGVVDSANNSVTLNSPVRVGFKKTFKIMFVNYSNFPFGAYKEDIVDFETGQPSRCFAVVGGMANKSHVPWLDTTGITIEFSPDKMGDDSAKYVIYSDIVNRKFSGYPENAKRIEFTIKATGIASNFTASTDTIDMGNINVIEGCPTSKNTFFLAGNNGNVTLKVTKIELLKPSPFTINNNISTLTIPADSQVSIPVTFSTEDQSPDSLFISKAIFYSDGSPQIDTVYLKARSLPPTTILLAMDTIYAKPGREIRIPVRVEKSKIALAKRFQGVISYDDESLLAFKGFDIQGTACNGGFKIPPKLVNDTILIEMKETFAESDTLIFLVFDTYLGHHVSTGINFSFPAFGDGICNSIFTVNKYKGVFSLDSICGLKQKAFDPTSGFSFQLEDIKPNPASDILELTYTVSEPTNVRIAMYNSFGQQVNELINNYMPAGTYVASVPVRDIPPGIYLCNMETEYSHSSKTIVITR